MNQNSLGHRTGIRREDRIAIMSGDDFTVVAVTSGESPIAGCVRHDVTIGKGDYIKTLGIHAQGVAPLVGAAVKRKRIGGNGVALIWSGSNGRASGGGFTLAAVPPDWRGLDKPLPAPVHQAVVGIDTQVPSDQGDA